MKWNRGGRGEGGSGRGLTTEDPPVWLPLYLPPRGMTSRTSSLPGECRRHAQDCTHVPASPVTFANNTFVSSCSPLHFLYTVTLPFHHSTSSFSLSFPRCPRLSRVHLFMFTSPPSTSSLSPVTLASLSPRPLRLSPFHLVAFSLSSPLPLTAHRPYPIRSPITFASLFSRPLGLPQPPGARRAWGSADPR